MHRTFTKRIIRFIKELLDVKILIHYNCIIDVTKLTTLKNKKSMTGKNLIGWVMNPDEVIDIDTQADLNFVKYFFKQNKI